MCSINSPYRLGSSNAISRPLPASRSAIKSLQTATSALPEGEDCPICFNEFVSSKEVKEMKCKHMFHKECIHKWLRVNATCPVCRYHMPVGDDDDDDSPVVMSVMNPVVSKVGRVLFGDLRGGYLDLVRVYGRDRELRRYQDEFNFAAISLSIPDSHYTSTSSTPNSLLPLPTHMFAVKICSRARYNKRYLLEADLLSMTFW
ncbi:zinc finger, RING/FYVE/PHD-type containing protein [Tanacetum coccineum]|uniref:Zinc finger, RING/FYVE/PHD-type containing protein n=1 Tax=Tanacetum coccineum TaxID=301880 RepID=A0ABQ5ITV1_9ASTR